MFRHLEHQNLSILSEDIGELMLDAKLVTNAQTHRIEQDSLRYFIGCNNVVLGVALVAYAAETTIFRGTSSIWSLRIMSILMGVMVSSLISFTTKPYTFILSSKTTVCRLLRSSVPELLHNPGSTYIFRNNRQILTFKVYKRPYQSLLSSICNNLQIFQF